ncbi:dynein light chain Tctex-type 1 [Pomacea canaliculata]|uniref:dynein light chain Tctex-type 1 n=1 Tax=Pomacea canaliculata TaxID=400727 RepID=UPI000D73ECB6|nr:dynein light chain Tctex-type 1 [Pomacea canaliculata]
MRLSPGTRESWLSTRQAGSTTSSLLHCLLLFHSFIKFKVIMDEFQSGEETAFVVDEVTNIIKEAIEGAIGGNAYQHNKVNQWTSSVVEQCLNQLTKLGKPFKYIVTCVIMQKNGAGLHTASSCYWDNATDGSCTVRWENKTMYCIVSVFGLAI